MAETLKVLAIDGKGQLVVVEEPLPDPEPGQVLVEVKASLVSPGTELGGVKRRRENPSDAPPRPFGYGNAGVVIGQGEGCEDIPVGTRLACMGAGYARHATHAAVPRNLTTPIPEGVDFGQASFACLAATALNAIRRGELQLGENVAVVGLGIVGQCACQLARLSGCHVMAIDRLPMRLDLATRTGAHLAVNATDVDAVAEADRFARGYGMDAAIMAFGGDGTDAFKMLVQMLKRAPDTHKMGRVVIVGGARIDHGFAAALGNIDVRSSARPGPGYHDEAWEHGADYAPVFVQWTTRRNMEECLRAVENGGMRVDPLVTHRVSLDEAPEACEALIQTPNEALGVVITP